MHLVTADVIDSDPWVLQSMLVLRIPPRTTSEPREGNQ